MNRFQIHNAYKQGITFIITGQLLEGKIAKGMNILLPLNSSLDLCGRISGIKKIDKMKWVLLENETKEVRDNEIARRLDISLLL